MFRVRHLSADECLINLPFSFPLQACSFIDQIDLGIRSHMYTPTCTNADRISWKRTRQNTSQRLASFILANNSASFTLPLSHMSRQHSSAYQVRDQRFNDKFPGSIVAVLAIVQMLTTFAVFAFEVGHDIVNLQLTNLFAGFWTAIPFTITWISMFSVGETLFDKDDFHRNMFHCFSLLLPSTQLCDTCSDAKLCQLGFRRYSHWNQHRVPSTTEQMLLQPKDLRELIVGQSNIGTIQVLFRQQYGQWLWKYSSGFD